MGTSSVNALPFRKDKTDGLAQGINNMNNDQNYNGPQCNGFSAPQGDNIDLKMNNGDTYTTFFDVSVNTNGKGYGHQDWINFATTNADMQNEPLLQVSWSFRMFEIDPQEIDSTDLTRASFM